ncbi:hypothetical protein [Nocardioides terrisoli]|uniref:hypothetical protein n=1 Tax=Nocardioides terrisoli TaxID=3388267 RepID=UPI00287B6BF8|nr:hypothetical protein [Nocardioides marmorisolisilvae]
MSDSSGAIGTDSGLLELAEMVLRDAGYELTSDAADDEPVLLAENHDNVAVVTAPITLERLLDADSSLTRFLVERLATTDPGRKRWDAYVVFLCAQPGTPNQTETLSGVSNNLRKVRRLLRVGVEPTTAGVSRALRPLLPLPTLSRPTAIADPLQELESFLLADGIEPEVLHAALTDFLIGGPYRAREVGEDQDWDNDSEDDPWQI